MVLKCGRDYVGAFILREYAVKIVVAMLMWRRQFPHVADAIAVADLKSCYGNEM